MRSTRHILPYYLAGQQPYITALRTQHSVKRPHRMKYLAAVFTHPCCQPTTLCTPIPSTFIAGQPTLSAAHLRHMSATNGTHHSCTLATFLAEMLCTRQLVAQNSFPAERQWIGALHHKTPNMAAKPDRRAGCVTNASSKQPLVPVHSGSVTTGGLQECCAWSASATQESWQHPSAHEC